MKWDRSNNGLLRIKTLPISFRGVSTADPRYFVNGPEGPLFATRDRANADAYLAGYNEARRLARLGL